MSDGVDSSTALLAMTQSIAAFTTFLPPLTQVRQNSVEDAGFRTDVRVGELAAAGLTIGVGAMISNLSKSPTPAMISVITAAGMVILYEWTLRVPAGPYTRLDKEPNT